VLPLLKLQKSKTSFFHAQLAGSETKFALQENFCPKMRNAAIAAKQNLHHGRPSNQRKPDGIYTSTEIKGQQYMASTRTCVSLVTRGLWPA